MPTSLHVLTTYEKEHLAERQPLPEAYVGLSDDEMDARIASARAALGRRLVILGHHYQRDEVIKFADYTGDSYKLAQLVVKHPDAEFIVFCGVHFMAESADVLSAPHQQVILPDLAAGCSMADMADPDQLEMCWADLDRMGVLGARNATTGVRTVVPVTYINSSAAIKAFCGERGGIVCTSSNAGATLKWAWERGEKVLFLPDQHLGRNTAFKMDVPLDDMVVWDPNEVWGSGDEQGIERLSPESQARGIAARHLQDPVGRPVGPVADHPSAVPLRVPEAAIRIDHGTVGHARLAAEVAEDPAVARLPRLGVVVERPDDGLGRVRVVHGPPIEAEAGAVRAAQSAEQAVQAQFGIEAVGGGQAFLAGVKTSDDETALAVAPAVVQARRGKVGLDLGDLVLRASPRIEEAEALFKRDQQPAALPEGERADFRAHGPAGKAPASRVQAHERLRLDVRPVQALAFFRPDRPFGMDATMRRSHLDGTVHPAYLPAESLPTLRPNPGRCQESA